jgi:hypothetical protein
MTPVGAFLSGVKAIIDSRPTYELGQDGSNGKCDCIGLIIGGLRRAGGIWDGTHGSNWAARNAIINLSESPRLEVGTILFKAYKPTDKGYSLPEKYAGHPDKLDYYHVGVVMSVEPLKIAHCTTGAGVNGIKIDTTMGRWKHGGHLKWLDEETKMDGYAIVSAPNGGTVNLRSSPTTLGNNILASPRTGERVSVLSKDSNWWRVGYNGTIGWMMREFLRLAEDWTVEQDLQDEPPARVDIDRVALLVEMQGLLTRQQAIIKALMGVK